MQLILSTYQQMEAQLSKQRGLTSEYFQNITLALSSEANYKWAGGCRDVNYTKSRHYSRTLHILQFSLAHGTTESKTSYTTEAMVLALANLVHLEGDVTISRHHLQGICGVVRLRGSIMSLRDKPKLLILLLKLVEPIPHGVLSRNVTNDDEADYILTRCDLAMAMHNSAQPVFLENIL